MAIAYIYKGAYVQTRFGREGKVIDVNRKNKIAIIVTNKGLFFSESFNNLQVIPRRGI